MNIPTIIISAILTVCIIIVLLAVTVGAELQSAGKGTDLQNTISGTVLQPAGQGVEIQDTIDGKVLQPARGDYQQ